MKLLTKAIIKRLPSLAETALLSTEEQMVLIKFFLPGTAATWWISAFDPSDRQCFGFTSLGDPLCAELGYISLDELEALRIGPFKVERDLYWIPKPLSEVITSVKNTGGCSDQ